MDQNTVILNRSCDNGFKPKNCHYESFPDFKGGSDPSHFIFEINVGKGRIRHTTTLKLNDEFQIGSKSIADDVIPILRRSMSDPPFSDIDFKNKMAWV